MDINVKDAVDALRPLVNQARGVLKLSEVLDGLIGVENHRDELASEIAKLIADKATLSEACDAAKVAAEAFVASARTQAEEARVAGTLASNDEAARVADRATRLLGAVAAERRDANARLEAAEAQLATLAAETADLQRFRDQLQSEIAALRARVQPLVE